MRNTLFFLFLLAAVTACGSSSEAQEKTQPSEKVATATTLEHAADLPEKAVNGDSTQLPLFDGFTPQETNTTNNSTPTTNSESTEADTSQPQTTLTTTTQDASSTTKATATTESQPSTTKPTPTVKPVHIELEISDCGAVPLNLSREDFLDKLYWHCLSRSRQLGQVTDKDWQQWMSKLVADDTPEFRKKTRDTSFYKSPEALCLDFDDRANCGNSPLPAISVPTNVTYGCKKTGDTILYIGKRRVERILHVCGESYPVKHGKN